MGPDHQGPPLQEVLLVAVYRTKTVVTDSSPPPPTSLPVQGVRASIQRSHLFIYHVFVDIITFVLRQKW